VFSEGTVAVTPAKLPNVVDLPRGHELPAARFRLGADDVRHYLEAVEDRSNAYGQGPEGPAWVPPLAVAALALRVILGQVGLPPGALHASQEVEFRRPVPVGASLRSRARVAQRSEMRGAVVSVIQFEVGEEGTPGPAVVGRATVIAPRGEAPS
jgi:hypothetical protein